MQSIEEKKKLLREKLANAEDRLERAMNEQGEACGDKCDWHDNSGYDLAVSLTETYQALVDLIKKDLRDLEKKSIS